MGSNLERLQMRSVFVTCMFIALVGQVCANEGGAAWRRDPRLASKTTKLEITGLGGSNVPAGTAYAWLKAHSEMNDCVTNGNIGKSVQITCTRRGKYYDTPGKPIKLIFTYTGAFPSPDRLVIISATTKGNPLIGQDLLDHFRDEIEE